MSLTSDLRPVFGSVFVFEVAQKGLWETVWKCMSFENSVGYVGGAAVVGATMGLGLYMASKSGTKISPMVDLQCQTRESPNGDGARVSGYLKDGQLMKTSFDDVSTLYEAMRRGAKESPSGDCLGYRKVLPDGTKPYVWTSYKEVLSRSEALAAGFLSLGLEVGQNTLIGIYSKNRPEWVITEHACYTYNMVIVPLYDTLGAEACSFILNRTEMELVICDDSKKAEALLQTKEPLISLKFVAVMDIPSESLKLAAERKNVIVLTMQEIEEKGKNMKDKPAAIPPKFDDLCTVCYTSGTTGTPKGVMLTHGNVISDCTTVVYFKYAELKPTDTMISFLPLAHMFERVLEAACFMKGGRIGFYGGDIRLLTDDIKELAPTIVPVVPRVLNRIFDKVIQGVGKSGLKRYLFDWALESKTKELNKCVVKNNGLWDKLVFRKVREGMGGNVRLMITGSAPCGENVLTFIRAALGCIVVEGYGQTECVAAASITVEGDHVPGHVGVPVPCCEIKLCDVPEMSYYSKNGKGEICVRGANVFKGYYKDEEKTKEALDDEGWLHTGDIGMWTPAYTLKIIDRKKHIFKLAQGEYVAPEKIENVYTSSRFVAQVFVHGESLKSCLVAIVVPDSEVLLKEAGKHHFGDKTLEELCQDEKIRKMILDDMSKLGKSAGLFGYEQVKDIHLIPIPFSIENNLLTPTLKSKRPQLREYFQSEIAQMYSHLE